MISWFLSLRLFFNLTNRVDPDEMCHVLPIIWVFTVLRVRHILGVKAIKTSATHANGYMDLTQSG